MADYYPSGWEDWTEEQQQAYIDAQETAVEENEAAAVEQCEPAEDEKQLIWVENGYLWFQDNEVGPIKLSGLLGDAQLEFIAWTNMRP